MTTIRPRRKRTPRREVEGQIVETRGQGDLRRITQPGVQAVIYQPLQLPGWMRDLARVVESGAFQIERVILQRATVDEIAAWLESNVPRGAVPTDLSRNFQSEVLSLVEVERELTGATHFMVRLFTETPTHRCGFHIDTATPRAPTIGLLRVFNGPGTLYVHPTNITSMGDVYRHLGQRERLGKQLEEAAREGAGARHEQLLGEIAALDEAPGFLRDPGDIRSVPEAAIVAFKHLDVRYHWSDHPKGMTWVHRSPSQGPARLVINITAWDPRAAAGRA